MKCLYLTGAEIGLETGDGVVTKHEYKALSELGDTTILEKKDIHPDVYMQPYSPFLIDYFAAVKIDRKYDLCHIYGGPYPVTVEKLKRDGCTVSITIPAHDRKTSIDEHEKCFGKYPFHHVQDPYLWSLHVKYMNLVDSIICPSTRSKRILEEEGVETPITVIPHGTEIPDTVAPLPVDFTVAYLGVVGMDKGLPYLMEAWSQLNYNDAELVFAGPGTDVISSMIQYGVEHGKFRLRGKVDKIRDVFDDCSVYVQPSTNEGFGITALEAMAHGRPVIISDGAGSSDCVVDSVNGFTVPAADSSAIATMIKWFKDHPDKVQELGDNARESSKQYSWDIIRSRYVEYFNQII
jgi:glycosyltransferase involved in cell wall biosynthesis